MHWRSLVLLVAFTTPLAVSGQAGSAGHDWPQFLGPSRNGIYDGPALAATWSAAGPRVVWSQARRRRA